MQKAAVALLLATAVLSLVATVEGGGFYFTADDLKSDDSLWELYGRWAAHHETVREPGRFAAFKDNVQERYAKKQRHAGDLMPLNVFGDGSFDEFAACCIETEEDWKEHYGERATTAATSGSPAHRQDGLFVDL